MQILSIMLIWVFQVPTRSDGEHLRRLKRPNSAEEDSNIRSSRNQRSEKVNSLMKSEPWRGAAGAARGLEEREGRPPPPRQHNASVSPFSEASKQGTMAALSAGLLLHFHRSPQHQASPLSQHPAQQPFQGPDQRSAPPPPPP